MTLPPSSALVAAAALVAAGLYGFLRGATQGLRAEAEGGAVRALLGLQVVFGAALLALPALGRSFAPLRLADPSAPHVLALLAAVISSSVAASIIGAVLGRERGRLPREEGPAERDLSNEAGLRGDGFATHAFLCVLGALGIAALALWAAS